MPLTASARSFPILFASALLMGACSQLTDSGSSDIPRGGGKADSRGSCQAADGDVLCGGASDGCWCDESCVDYDDCCADYASVCTADAYWISPDPFEETGCAYSDPQSASFPESTAIATIQARNPIPYRLAVRKQLCTAADGCGAWQAQDHLWGASLDGVAYPSSVSNSYSFFVRLEGDERTDSSGRTRKLRTDCLIESDMRCGYFQLLEKDSSGEFIEVANPKNETDAPYAYSGPYLNFFGSLTDSCMYQHTPISWRSGGVNGSTFDRWDAALLTEW